MATPKTAKPKTKRTRKPTTCGTICEGPTHVGVACDLPAGHDPAHHHRATVPIPAGHETVYWSSAHR